MPGLVPGIHVPTGQDVDGCNEYGNDGKDDPD
jgi:hypothetical protein